jgi:hypothetical protein
MATGVFGQVGYGPVHCDGDPNRLGFLSKKESQALLNECPALVKKYKDIDKEMNPAKKDECRAEIQRINDIFKGATVKSGAELMCIHIRGAAEDLLGVAYFVNRRLLDIEKLPPGPLTISADAINGQALQNFIVN